MQSNQSPITSHQSPVSSLQSPVSGKTTIVGLIGWPVSHSVSPAMHNAAFAALGLDWRYVPLPVLTEPSERIGEAVRGLRALHLRGANVTVPHKQAVMPFVDQLTPAAQAIGAVNTLWIEDDGAIAGDNTDAAGFIADLRDHSIDPSGQNVLILGAGGSARAIVYGLAAAGARTITIANRTVERAANLANEMQQHFADCMIHAQPLADLTDVGRSADLIVNTTSLGMTPNVDTMAWDDNIPFGASQVVYDLVYNPPQTRLLQKAAADGAQVVGGLGMLIWQGALAFERWTGQQPSVDHMRCAAVAELRARGVLPPLKPDPTVEVRRATSADVQLISALNADVQQLHADALPHIFKPPTQGGWSATDIAQLMANPTHYFWIAMCEGRAGGGYLYVEQRHSPADATRHERNTLYIHHLAVKPAFQRRGCGEALLVAIKQFARQEQITTLVLDTWAFNERAQRFFMEQGFQTFNYRMWREV